MRAASEVEAAADQFIDQYDGSELEFLEEEEILPAATSGEELPEQVRSLVERSPEHADERHRHQDGLHGDTHASRGQHWLLHDVLDRRPGTS